MLVVVVGGAVVVVAVVVVVVSHTPAAHVPMPLSHDVPSGSEASAGQSALVPVQLSATSQSPID
jgi:hypothetical protein